MRNRRTKNNFNTLITSEMEKRFEDVVKEEYQKYSKLDSDLHLKLREHKQYLQDAVSSIQKQIIVLEKYLLDEFRMMFSAVKDELISIRHVSNKNIEEAREYKNDLSESLKKKLNIEEYEELKKIISKKIETFIEIGFEDQKSMKISLHESNKKNEQNNEKLSQTLEEQINSIQKKIDILDKKMQETNSLYDSCLKELRTNHQDTFIQEKKIEHIYTLLERKKNGGVKS